MTRTARLYDLVTILRDGALHTAPDLARHLGVSVRTIYRDMETLANAGVPVGGTRGAGYRLVDTIALPPLALEPAELDALNLGIAIVAEAGDDALASAARSLLQKLEAALPAEGIAPADHWKFAPTPLANIARGLRHIPTLRSAIKARQKLRLAYVYAETGPTMQTIRPLRLESIGPAWLLTAWCETSDDFRDFRLDLIDTATALPELFEDEPGKTLDDYRARKP